MKVLLKVQVSLTVFLPTHLIDGKLRIKDKTCMENGEWGIKREWETEDEG